MSANDAKQTYINFDEYIRQGEPAQREAAYAWSTAIGLQAVDGLKTSDYLNDLARRNIEGEITIDEVGKLLDEYYKDKKKKRVTNNHRTTSRTSAEQVPEQARDLFHTNNPLIFDLVKKIGFEEWSIAQIMKALGLKHRPNFLEYHLNPAISEGLVRMLYPDKPHHPRQKYLLTTKGILLYNDIKEK